MKRGESLRDEFARRYAVGGYFTLDEAVAAMVPLIGSLAEHHSAGIPLFVHPSSLRFRANVCTIDLDAAADMPTLPTDRACLAPEERESPEGGPAASVFSCGAILYEMLTGEAVGPSMLRPSERAPEVSEAFELLLGKALVTDPNQRPSDLRALAQALHRCAPSDSNAPPAVADDAMDESLDIDFDVSMSLLPPLTSAVRQSLVDISIARAKAVTHAAHEPDEPATRSTRAATAGDNGAQSPRAAVSAPLPRSGHGAPKGATERLAELKARLEADPRPRYVVIKDGMDHGPFSAVELLHQIATRSFAASHDLLDTFSKEERPISEWPEFAPFAEQAQRGVDAQLERKQRAASVSAESDRTRVKTLVTASIAVLGLAALAGFYFRYGKARSDEGGVKGDRSQNVDFDGDVAKGKGGGKGPGGKGLGGRALGGSKNDGDGSGDTDAPSESGGAVHPIVPDGLSCESARAKYIEDYSKEVPPDLTAGSYGAVLNRGDYLNACGVPPSMSVTICAAVQNGHAAGVTVSTNPPNGGIARCVSGQVRSLPFPSHPRLDVSTTTFAGQ